jgi:uncharacterized integral membrane protein (TIGR00698 family)
MRMNFTKRISLGPAAELKAAAPGLGLAVGVALAARGLHTLLPGEELGRIVSEVLLAVLLGLLVRNVLRPGSWPLAGVRFAIQRVLRLGIILLGLRLSLQEVAATGMGALVLIAACVAVALGLAYAAGRVFKISGRLAALIGLGTGICGYTAIAAAAPVIEAKEEEVSFAVATITLFGLLAVLFYPLIGQLGGLPDRAFGLWAGTAVNDTSQVVAAGAAYSPAALNVATVVKLTRNILLAPLLVLLSIGYQRRQAAQLAGEGGIQKGRAKPPALGKLLPHFVAWFLLMSLVRTAGVAIGVLPQDVSQPGELVGAAAVLLALDQGARFAILIALAAVGLSTNLAILRGIGYKPLVVGTLAAVGLALTSLALILLTPLGG